MTAGTITLTANSTAVTGAGTKFKADVKAGDLLVAIVGGTAYTLPVKEVTADNKLTIVLPYTGPTTAKLAWSSVPRDTANTITAGLAAQVTHAMRGLNHDKINWQQVFSATGDITVTLPDGTKFTGPSWKKLADLIKKFDLSLYLKKEDAKKEYIPVKGGKLVGNIIADYAKQYIANDKEGKPHNIATIMNRNNEDVNIISNQELPTILQSKGQPRVQFNNNAGYLLTSLGEQKTDKVVANDLIASRNNAGGWGGGVMLRNSNPAANARNALIMQYGGAGANMITLEGVLIAGGSTWLEVFVNSTGKEGEDALKDRRSGIFRFKGDTRAVETLDATLWENGQRVYSPNSPQPHSLFADRRYAENEAPITHALDRLEEIVGVTFTQHGEELVGVMAQDVEKVLPQAVESAERYNYKQPTQDLKETKYVDYSAVCALLVESVKELSAKVDRLEAIIAGHKVDTLD